MQDSAPLAWEALPDGCWRLASPGFAVNSGLIVGASRAVLIDTGSGPRQAAAIHRAVRRITDRELVVVNTHGHGDHFLGNDFFRAHGVTDFYSGTLARQYMGDTAAQQRALVREIEPEMAEGIGAHTGIHLPNHQIGSAPQTVNLGDRFITLQQLGSAHSPGDLSVHAGRVLFVGDLVEQGGPPNFADSRPRQWLRLLGELSSTEAPDTRYVPGHGGTVDGDFLRRQATELREAIEVCRQLAQRHQAGWNPGDEELSALPYSRIESRFLYERMLATGP